MSSLSHSSQRRGCRSHLEMPFASLRSGSSLPTKYTYNHKSKSYQFPEPTLILEIVTCLTSWYRDLWDIEKKQFFLFCPPKWSDCKTWFCGSLCALPRTCYAASGISSETTFEVRQMLCLCKLPGLSLLFHSKSFEEPLQMILSSTMLDCTVFHYLDFTWSVYSLLFHYRILVYHLSL